MIDRDMPIDPERELTEFIMDISSERFLYESWLEKAGTLTHLTCSGFRGRLRTLPEFVRHFPGIADDIEVGLAATKSIDGVMQLEKMTIRTPDTMDITIENDHGLLLMHHDGGSSLMPSDALETLFMGLFSERDHMKPFDVLARYIFDKSPCSIEERVFEGIGMNDNAVRVVLVNNEDGDNSSMALEVTTTLIHPSDALIGTRLTIFDSLAKAQRSLVPQANVTIDVIRENQTGVFTVASLLSPNRSVDVKRPTHYHEGNIIEALYALEQAAKNKA